MTFMKKVTIIYKTRCGWKAYSDEVNIYDMRDDKSVPITADTVFVTYLVYLSTTDNVLIFSVFACDIVGYLLKKGDL